MPSGLVDALRKASAVVLVLGSVTLGIVGLMYATEGGWWGIGLIVLTPVGIWTATRITPEGGTSGYCDDKI